MIRLVQEFGAQAGRQLQFDKDLVRIGRAPDNDVVFDPNVDLDASGRHCELFLESGDWYVVDAASRNGTFVNGQQVQRQRLAPNDMIECGKGGPRLRVDLPGRLAAVAVPQPPSAPQVYGATVAVPLVSMPAGPLGAAPMGAPPMGLPMGAMPFGAPPVGMAMGAPPLGGSPPGMGAPPMGFGGFPAGNGSVGQAFAAGLPQGAQVGKRTVALMIDQALAQSEQRRGRGSGGLRAMVALLTVLVLGGLGAGAWAIWDDRESRDEDRARPGLAGDPSTAGARLAAANEANIYMLAVAQGGQRDRGFCTAFAVTRDLLATNAHCVNVARQEMARGGQIVALRNKTPGARMSVTPVYMDRRFEDRGQSRGGSGYDVGLVRTGEALPSAVRLAGESELYALHEGDAIFVYGFPGMTMNETSPVATITLGLINRLTDFFDNVAQPALAQKLQHSAQTSSGSSGSPIFLPAGTVVGINAGSLADEERQVVYDPVSHQQREVEVNRGSNFKYGMRADLIRQAIESVDGSRR